MNIAATISRTVFIVFAFLLSNTAFASFGMEISLLLLGIGLIIAIIIGDHVGILLYGLYLCRNGKSSEINKWASSVVHKGYFGTKVLSYLKGHSATCK